MLALMSPSDTHKIGEIVSYNIKVSLELTPAEFLNLFDAVAMHCTSLLGDVEELNKPEDLEERLLFESSLASATNVYEQLEAVRKQNQSVIDSFSENY
jgi:hypothetical protein